MIGLASASTKGVKGILLNEIPESGKPQFRYHIDVLAPTISMLGAVSLYSFTLWALTNDLRLTKCFPWSDGPLSNWMIWLALALTWNFVAVNIYRMRTWVGRPKVLLNYLSRFGTLARPEEPQIAGQLASSGE